MRWSKERIKKDFKLKIRRRSLNLRLKKRRDPGISFRLLERTYNSILVQKDAVQLYGDQEDPE